MGLLLLLSPKSYLLSMKSRAAIQSVREKYTGTIHGNTALRQRKKRMERKRSLKGCQCCGAACLVSSGDAAADF